MVSFDCMMRLCRRQIEFFSTNRRSLHRSEIEAKKVDFNQVTEIRSVLYWSHFNPPKLNSFSFYSV